jgi:hypothetical protein
MDKAKFECHSNKSEQIEPKERKTLNSSVFVYSLPLVAK